MKKFSFPKNMVRADVFLQVLWQFLSAQRSFDFWISRGDFLAAFGGEIGSNYFKNTAPSRKSPVHRVRLASLGDQIVWIFGLKTELAVFDGKRKFFIN